MADSLEAKGTQTSDFGVGRREAHDSSKFYAGRMFDAANLGKEIPAGDLLKIPVPAPGEWADQIYAQSAEQMNQIPDNSVGLAVTSPPYNVGKQYDDDLTLDEYLQMIQKVGEEVYRVLRPGGRYLVNVANLGRKPYIPLTAYYYDVHLHAGFLPMGEIVWQKGKGASGSTAWGSWMSAKAPRLRDIHEYILVFAKQAYSRPDRGESDIEKEEFLAGTLSVWEIAPESAKRIGHPAPFPVALIERTIQLFSYKGDVVLDPFMGSGTTAVAALKTQRKYVGYEINPGYVELAEHRIQASLEGLGS